MKVLVVDDERPALDELAYLLAAEQRVGEVVTSSSATDALRILREGTIDAVFLDVQMPGLTGLELAQVLGRFRAPPPVVFVTAHERHAVEAFDLHAVDYVLKPVRADRLAEAVRRVVAAVGGTTEAAPARDDAQVAVERGGVTRFINRCDITHVEAQGDYARLHTASESHLLRSPLTTLEEEWAAAGFVRIHRSLLVSLSHVSEVRMDGGRCTVVVGPRGGQHGVELGVSRRHTRELRELLLASRTVGP
ncbi:LytR/AlgR family response regulator transcription factor [Nocardioides sp. URHA0020]|uniref:LytR/AlgR family response regulator transcription factor n=1 Tax=Nocardioides sp. URHA0020 TaxID=1380392 RepID=UPI000490F839|nr:LytTR family DNA-binding domain-containing protein [Nocardioides sp. URHA0020]